MFSMVDEVLIQQTQMALSVGDDALRGQFHHAFDYVSEMLESSWGVRR